MMINKLLRSCNRQLHTIVSKDIVKPSSPTPSHLRTHQLSILDQLSVDTFSPLVAFYPSLGNHQNPHDANIDLKKSLSYTLTKYYPFAGRMDKVGPSYMDCNDEGVEFIEAHYDDTLSDFLKNTEHKDYDQLFANNLSWYNHNRKGHIYEYSRTICPLAVQVNHFACGGIAVTTSLSHKIADASGSFNFMNHWATANRLLSKGDNFNDIESQINPYFFQYQPRNVQVLKTMPTRPEGQDCVTKPFLFSNSKIKKLKDKVIGMTAGTEQPITNATRAEALTWLINKCATNASTKINSGVFTPTGVMHIANVRSQFVEKMPPTSIGNFYRVIEFPTINESEVTPSKIIGEIQQQKKGIPGMQNFETLLGVIADTYSEKGVLDALERNDKSYVYSFLNRFPSYGIDFGFGKPIKVTMGGNLKNVTLTYEAPNGDGIVAYVCLEREEMKIFENDPELLPFVDL